MTANLTAPHPLPRTDYPSRTNPAARAAYAAGLRHLADLIEADPHCPYPQGPLNLFVDATDDHDQAERAAYLRRALGGGKWEKTEASSYLTLDGMCAGVPINLWMDRQSVCERVVVGEEQVEIPALPARDARVETREIVEWRCHPLLSAADETPAQVTA